ncbi:HAD-IC family P-type ATPase [Methylocystis bryophila]|uniref:Cation-transporting P-type ATPase N-terminal domain-containing protein n=1 Tax=Methylocystis bryophila TaxID=655015 RepID=A0A1W6MQQ9_9HYPH|nr:HAD-IC family P-type ATPase [Methylocystis bryophila]ARN79905.1 hypothetical protein B1812_01135 [Methylocystis bryophila]BDV39800.1 hypothetical protein DSM21852_30530 [Methylocystis bryophila]
MDPGVSEGSNDAPWHCLSTTESLQRLASSSHGLTRSQADEALARHGPNTITVSEAFSPWTIFLSQFKSALIWILVAASIVSGALGESEDSIAILAIVVLNALVGFYQEYSAEKSIAALKQMAAPRARVIRDGEARTIPASRIVPGDIIEFEAGDLIAADARLISASALSCVESALTGEPEAVVKQPGALQERNLPVGDRVNMVFLGTSVAAGVGRGVVVATGMQTEIGRIAALIREAGEGRETPLQQKLDRFGRTLLWATLGIVALLFGLGLLRKEPIVDLFMTSVSLAVAALPESLPAVATAALSLGVMRMSRRRALVRRLASVETLGSTNVICSDKTGTLTEGRMSAQTMFVAERRYEIEGEGYEPRGAIRSGGVTISPEGDSPLRKMADNLVGCNNARLESVGDSWTVIGDPTEGALLCAGLKSGGDPVALERACPQLYEIPFDSDRKLHSTLRWLAEGRVRLLTNGAPEALLARASQVLGREGVHAVTEEERAALLHHNASLASQGFRVLGCAFRDFDAAPSPVDPVEVERDLIFLGLCGLRDPPRREAREAIAKCRSAGIRVVMITGDHPRTAKAIALDLGFEGDGETVTGVMLDALDDNALAARVPRISVYARVSAAHKLRIVRAWQANGAVVSMTGDGVNDAPAIKGADIGVAMGLSGSEVTKQASDMIITDDNFATIVDAVEEGRGIFENIKNTLQYLLSCNAAELLLMTVCIVSGFPSPLLPIHLLWINLVTDGPPALCLAADRANPEVMSHLPRDRDQPLTDRSFLETMLLTAAPVAALTFLVFLYGLQTGGLTLGRSYAFTSMVFSQLFVALSARNGMTPFWRRNPLSNPYLIVVTGALIFIQLSSHQSASFAHLLQVAELSLHEEILLLAASATPMLLLELVKSASHFVASQEAGAAEPRRPWMNWITAGVILAGAAGAWLQWPAREGTSASYVTGGVERRPVRRTIDATIEPRKTQVLSPMPGVVRFHDCEVGSLVVENQLCAAIEDGASRAETARLQAAAAKTRAVAAKQEIRLLGARKALAQARAAKARRRILAAQRRYEEIRRALLQLNTLAVRYEAAFARVEREGARREVRAPAAGVVSERAAQGAIVRKDDLLFVVNADDRLGNTFAIATRDIEGIKVGDRVFVVVADEMLPAHVKSVDEAQKRAVIGLDSGAEARLSPGLTAVRIEVEPGKERLFAPNEAVRYAQEKCKRTHERHCVSQLWVLREGNPVVVPVELGSSDGKRTEILGGDLKAEESLILEDGR